MTTVKDTPGETDVPWIAPAEAKALLGRPDVVFLDVREPAEIAASGKVAGAVTVPLGVVPLAADPAAPGHEPALDPQKTVIAYCGSGKRSALAGQALKRLGFASVRNLGGFNGWLEAGGPVERA